MNPNSAAAARNQAMSAAIGLCGSSRQKLVSLRRNR